MKNKLLLLGTVILVCLMCSATVLAEELTAAAPAANLFIGTFWSLVPPLVAIVLALITKEVYSSLFAGIVVGALFYNNFNVVGAVDTMVQDGLIASVSGTAGIFVFLVLLGTITALINKAGVSAAFGAWATKNIKSKTGAIFCSFVLGVLIFIDDYFNCLTVGSVMRPVTDSHKISRAKLAYVIDATAAPICMIAPISSWAAAVAEYTSGVVDAAGNEISSLALFCRAIPYNFYSLLTLTFIVAITLLKLDFGPMRRHEINAANGDLFTHGGEVIMQGKEINHRNDHVDTNHESHVLDLVLPIVVLIALSVMALIYVGEFFLPESALFHDFAGAFANTDSTVGLPLGGLIALLFTMAYLICRRLLTFKEAMNCGPAGFTAMVPAILILTLATALKSMTGLLESDTFVKGALANAGSLHSFLPAIIFLVACGISFATGTSWGTFGILIPIVLDIFAPGSELSLIGMSACLAGAVCGDHCSPISDTTIMSSAGAQCEHINHISTQLPYALTVAAFSFVSYLISGFIQNWLIVLPLSIAMMIGTLLVLRLILGRTSDRQAA